MQYQCCLSVQNHQEQRHWARLNVPKLQAHSSWSSRRTHIANLTDTAPVQADTHSFRSAPCMKKKRLFGIAPVPQLPVHIFQACHESWRITKGAGQHAWAKAAAQYPQARQLAGVLHCQFHIFILIMGHPVLQAFSRIHLDHRPPSPAGIVAFSS
eukprot:scaffold29765_cov21-Tisochrysis_lutea.AAC.1